MASKNRSSITLGTAALLLVIAALVTVAAYQQTTIQREVQPEPAPSGVTAGETADPSGDVRTVSVQSVFSGKDKLAFVHECQGTVVTPPPFSYMSDDAVMPSYCVGKNFLSVKDMAGAEIALVSESTSTSAEDAPILGSVTWVRHYPVGRNIGNNGMILIEYGIVPCSVSEDACGVGLPANNVTFAMDLPTQGIRPIQNYPESGTPIWNASGTKAIFPVTQRGGAGCDDGPILGYDLLKDETRALTTERACEFDNGPSQDVEGNLFPVWGPTFWTSNDTFTSVLLGTDGKWRQIDGTF